MDPATIAQLALIAEQLIVNGIAAYRQYEQAASAAGASITPIATILADADSRFDAIVAASTT